MGNTRSSEILLVYQKSIDIRISTKEVQMFGCALETATCVVAMKPNLGDHAVLVLGYVLGDVETRCNGILYLAK